MPRRPDFGEISAEGWATGELSVISESGVEIGVSREAQPYSVTGADTMSSAFPMAFEYHRWFYELAEPYLGTLILDVGSGLGSHLPFFEGRRFISLDVSAECVRRLESDFGGDGREFVTGDICDPSVSERLRTKNIDTVTCFNVMEHIENDRQMISNVRHILEPKGGRLVLIVPAHQRLYGRLDRFAGHYRRYDRGHLCRVLETCGFEILFSRYINAIGALGWFVNGRVLKPKSLSSPSVNAQLIYFSRLIVPVLKRLERKLRPPFGQSLLVVARPDQRPQGTLGAHASSVPSKRSDTH